eukprot:GHVS01091215.1.p1 GENE.GHVS01091215.1~~GHVS01091215.1.p1  ORF type:complete len:129 (-),score=4.05 GHVS01091215.1:542-928(-)
MYKYMYANVETRASDQTHAYTLLCICTYIYPSPNSYLSLSRSIHFIIGLTAVGVIPLVRMLNANPQPFYLFNTSSSSPPFVLSLPQRFLAFSCLVLCLSLCAAEAMPTLFWPLLHRTVFVCEKLAHKL